MLHDAAARFLAQHARHEPRRSPPGFLRPGAEGDVCHLHTVRGARGDPATTTGAANLVLRGLH